MSHHPYHEWRPDVARRHFDLPHKQRLRSRSPVREFTQKTTFRNHSYEDDVRKRGMPVGQRQSGFELTNTRWTGENANNMEQKRRSIDLRMQREELVSLTQEEEGRWQMNAEDEERREEELKEKASRISVMRPSVAPLSSGIMAGVKKDDLRILLEQTRTANQSLTPPSGSRALVDSTGNLVPAESNHGNRGPSSVFVQNTYVPITLNNIHPVEGKVPEFERSRLSGAPGVGEPSPHRLLSNNSLKGSLKLDDPRETLVYNFRSDCDAVALVTQMLIDEDPSLEPALVKAMKGVLQKVMKKHLDAIPK